MLDLRGNESMCQSVSSLSHRLGNTAEGFDRDLRSPLSIAYRRVIWNPQSRRGFSHPGSGLSGNAKHRLLARRPAEWLAPARRRRRIAGRLIESCGQFNDALPDEHSTVEG